MPSRLKDFKQQDLLTQIQTLEAIKQEQNLGALEDLYALFADPLGDSTIDYMVGMTLRDLLSRDTDAALAGLQDERPAVQKLCAQMCGQSKIDAAAPRLLELLDSARQTADAALFHAVLSAMTAIKAPEFKDVFKELVNHTEDDVAALAIGMLGEYRDADAVDMLMALISDGESDANYQRCDLKTGAAIEALAAIADARAIEYLVSKLHYRNPAGRLMVHQVLKAIGADVVPYLEAAIETDDVDMKIMIANLIGQLKDKRGGEILISAVDRGAVTDPNVKYAIYEALGYIPFMKGVVFLMDGLNETDPLILTAVVAALENQLNPGVVNKISELIQNGETQGRQVAQAVVTARAVGIFEALYGSSPAAAILLEQIRQSNDPLVIKAFQEKLAQMPDAEAKQEAASLAALTGRKTGGLSVLAADDSKAMVAFYRATVSGFGCNVQTAENGKEALDIIEQGTVFDLIITDMNMPVMDGIDLTRRIRTHPGSENVPVIMITTESDASQVSLAESAGVNAFLNKPFTPDALRAKISEFLTLPD